MDFSVSEDQTAIKELAHQIFSDKATADRLLELDRADQDYDTELWSILAEQGILGLSVPESLGGSGLGLIELCMILEEQGAHVAPVPLLANLVLGALPIIEFGTEQQQSAVVKPMMAGELNVTAAIAELGMRPARVTPVTASKNSQGWLLNGLVDCVQDGAIARFVLVPVDVSGRCSVLLVDLEHAGIDVQAQQLGLLGKWNARIQFNDAQLPVEALLGSEGQGDDIIEWIEQRANVAHCALQTGVSESAMKQTAAYTSERKQFGVPIGSFQALAMRMADAFIDVEAIRSTYWLALWRLSEGLDARIEIRAAKFWACEGAHRVVCTAQHLHGGMGADVEYPIHRYFLWSKMIAYSLGGGSHQLQKLGELLASNDNLGLAALEA